MCTTWCVCSNGNVKNSRKMTSAVDATYQTKLMTLMGGYRGSVVRSHYMFCYGFVRSRLCYPVI